MPGAAIIGAALNTGAAVHWSIWLQGVDVWREPGTSPRYAVPAESIIVEERGHDQTSAMQFVIEDLSQALAVTEGMTVRMWSHDNSEYAFSGWVDHFEIRYMPGNQGTEYTIQCIGIESVLDWTLLLNDVTIPAATNIATAVESLCAQTTGFAWDNMTITLAVGQSTVGAGLQNLSATNIGVTIPAGTTLRSAINQLTDNVQDPTWPTWCTVDFFGTLRLWTQNPSSLGMDYVGITASGDVGGSGYIEYGIDAAQVRSIYIKGTGIAGLVTDGTNRPGPVAYVEDATITTVAQRDAAAKGYLAGFAVSARGRYTTTALSPAPIYAHPGTNIDISASVLGISASTRFFVTGITRTWVSGTRGDVVYFFGGADPSLARLTRQLTRNTLS
jgi:hypothetical protein